MNTVVYYGYSLNDARSRSLLRNRDQMRIVTKNPLWPIQNAHNALPRFLYTG